jgi:hypothetical protein
MDSLVETCAPPRAAEVESSAYPVQRRDRTTISRCLSLLLTLSAAILFGVTHAEDGTAADDVSAAQMQSLDEQVQEIKSNVLGIAAELSRLEEVLLYPSNTQVAVFVSLADEDDSRLDSVQIQIDGESVAHHIYSFKELEALQKGGVQRLYTGNLSTGEHRLEVSVSGKLSNGKDFSTSETFSFEKDVEPKLVGLSLALNETGDARIQLGGR